LQKLKTKVLEPADTQALMKSITPDRCQQEFQETGSCDFGFAFGDACRFRVSVFRQRGNIAMVLRQIPVKMWTMDELGLPQIFKSMITRPRGLVIVTGPTGSGKTTSLAAMVDYLNDNYDHHIITIEDPIEFQHNHKKSTINQREVGVDVTSFKEALAAGPAPGSGRHHGRRKCATSRRSRRPSPRPRRSHCVWNAAHVECGRHDQPHHRRISDEPAGADSHAAGSAIIGILCQQTIEKSGGGRSPAFETLVVTPGIREPDSREQNLPDHVVDSNRCAARMMLLDDHIFNLWRQG